MYLCIKNKKNVQIKINLSQIINNFMFYKIVKIPYSLINKI